MLENQPFSIIIILIVDFLLHLIYPIYMQDLPLFLSDAITRNLIKYFQNLTINPEEELFIEIDDDKILSSIIINSYIKKLANELNLSIEEIVNFAINTFTLEHRNGLTELYKTSIFAIQEYPDLKEEEKNKLIKFIINYFKGVNYD